MDRYDTIGIDLVAMSVNDVSACGAVPLFFLDYIVTGKVEPEKVAALVGGVDEGCLRAQCVLLGGETADTPGHFKADDDFDMAGFAVGIAERDELWGPGHVVAGDVLIGIDAHGLHSNGFSLVRHLLEKSRHRPAQQVPQPGRRPRRLRRPGDGVVPALLRRARASATCCSPPPRSTAPCFMTSGTPEACTRRRT